MAELQKKHKQERTRLQTEAEEGLKRIHKAAADEKKKIESRARKQKDKHGADRAKLEAEEGPARDALVKENDKMRDKIAKHRQAEKAKLEPMEISIDPVVTIINCAKASSNKTGVCWAMNVQLRTDIKRSPEMAQNIKITNAMAMKGT